MTYFLYLLTYLSIYPLFLCLFFFGGGGGGGGGGVLGEQAQADAIDRGDQGTQKLILSYVGRV